MKPDVQNESTFVFTTSATESEDAQVFVKNICAEPEFLQEVGTIGTEPNLYNLFDESAAAGISIITCTCTCTSNSTSNITCKYCSSLKQNIENPT